MVEFVLAKTEKYMGVVRLDGDLRNLSDLFIWKQLLEEIHVICYPGSSLSTTSIRLYLLKEEMTSTNFVQHFTHSTYPCILSVSMQANPPDLPNCPFQILPLNLRHYRFSIGSLEQQQQLNHQGFGYRLTSPLDYKAHLQKVPNWFLTCQQRQLRQFQLTHANGIKCQLCPKSLQRIEFDPSLNSLRLHIHTRWHKRYLTLAIEGPKSAYKISSTLQSQFEDEFYHQQTLNSQIEQLHLSKHHPTPLVFGYRKQQQQDPGARHEYKRRHQAAIRIQSSFRQYQARRRLQELRRQRQEQQERDAKMKTSQKYIWHALVRDLCKHCTTTQLCRQHQSQLQVDFVAEEHDA